MTAQPIRPTMAELEHMPLVRTRRERIAARKEAILAAIATKARTVPEISEATGIPLVSTWRYVHQLHDAGQLHVKSWRKTGYTTEAYIAGPGRDAKKPEPQTVAQISARKVRKRQADPERQMEYDRKQRARYQVNHIGKVHRDPLVEALFGKAA